MLSAAPHTALLLLVVLCPLSHALYEDQVGQHDWYHMHIGRVTSMVSDPSVNRRLVRPRAGDRQNHAPVARANVHFTFSLDLGTRYDLV